MEDVHLMKKLLTVIMALTIVFCMSIDVFAASSVTASAPTEVEHGKSFELKVSINDNPGVSSIKIRVKYNSKAFTYDSYTEGGLFPTLMSSKSTGSVTISADSGGDVFKSGTYATLKFTANGNSGASGNFIVEVTSASDSSGRSIGFDGVTIPVTIKGGAAVTTAATAATTAATEEEDVIILGDETEPTTKATTKETTKATKKTTEKTTKKTKKEPEPTTKATTTEPTTTPEPTTSSEPTTTEPPVTTPEPTTEPPVTTSAPETTPEPTTPQNATYDIPAGSEPPVPVQDDNMASKGIIALALLAIVAAVTAVTVVEYIRRRQ